MNWKLELRTTIILKAIWMQTSKIDILLFFGIWLCTVMSGNFPGMSELWSVLHHSEPSLHTFPSCSHSNAKFCILQALQNVKIRTYTLKTFKLHLNIALRDLCWNEIRYRRQRKKTRLIDDQLLGETMHTSGQCRLPPRILLWLLVGRDYLKTRKLNRIVLFLEDVDLKEGSCESGGAPKPMRPAALPCNLGSFSFPSSWQWPSFAQPDKQRLSKLEALATPPLQGKYSMCTSSKANTRDWIISDGHLAQWMTLTSHPWQKCFVSSTKLETHDKLGPLALLASFSFPQELHFLTAGQDLKAQTCFPPLWNLRT